MLTLLLVTVLAYGARSAVTAEFMVRGATLGFGFLLVAGIQTGHIFHALKLPHLTGYLICGLVFGPAVLGLLSSTMVTDLALVKNVAVGLIGLLAGCELNARALRPQLRSIGLITVATTALAFVLVFAFAWQLTGTLESTAAFTPAQRAAIASVAAIVVAAFSPSAVMGILTETRAEGPLSRLALSSVVANNLAIAILFSIANTVALRVIPGSAAVAELSTLAWQIMMSLAIGALVGAVLGVYITRVGRRNGLVIFGVLLVVAEAGFSAGIDPLLAGLAAGLFLENVTPVSGREIIRQTEPATLPTFVIFFGVVGAELHLAEFFHVAHWALLVAAIRALAIYAGVRLAWRRAGLDEPLARRIPLGLLPQAGIALALSSIVETSFDPWGAQIATLLFGVVVVNEIVGPVLFKIALARAGEIPAAQTPTSAPEASPAS